MGVSLNTKNLAKVYGKNNIFDNVNISFSSGDIVALVGENGCGKSTLLNILAGADRKYQGEISYNIDNVKPDNRILGEYIGYVPQNNFILKELSIRDNLLFWYKGDKGVLERTLNEGIVAQLKLTEYIDVRIDKLSVGIQKRVALAGALAGNPKVLILDEVNSSLDMAVKLQIQDFLQEYAKNNNLVIMSTHDEGDLNICNKICLMKNGHVEQVKKTSLRELIRYE